MYKEVGFALLILYHFQGIFFFKKNVGGGGGAGCGAILCVRSDQAELGFFCSTLLDYETFVNIFNCPHNYFWGQHLLM